MSAFGAYAHYYDLLYRDKDYGAEARFVHGLLQKHAPGARRVLDLGCGTGAHAVELAALGYAVHGVDRSPEMLALAGERRAALPGQGQERISFGVGDVTDLRLGRTFDAVVALFHVMSYLTSQNDLRAGLASARAHLGRGGLLLFDVWNGVAVEAQRPEVRTKRVATDECSITRVATPTLAPDEQLVRVRYDLTVTSRHDPVPERITELHVLRYLFAEELVALLAAVGLDIEARAAWMTETAPGPDDWNVYVLARAS